MIVFLTLIYVAILFLAIKIGLVRLNTFWKISPLLWMALLLLVLFVPMQWGAPAGAVRLYQSVIEIVPSVNGEVTEIMVKPLVPVQRRSFQSPDRPVICKPGTRYTNYGQGCRTAGGY
jgi:hypothetical protein